MTSSGPTPDPVPAPASGPAAPGRPLPSLRRSPMIWTCAGLLLLIALAAALAPVIAPHPGDATGGTDPAQALLPPSAEHWFGTDHLGRDVLSRVLYGARIGPVIALLVVAVSVLVGTAVGLAAGYFGGWIDEVLMRLTDVFLAVPALLLALALAAVLPPGVVGLTIALTVTWWPWYARLVRGEAASVAGRAHVDACRALGLPHRRILLRHVLPGTTTPLLVQASTDIGGVILVAAGLSFLGLGAQSPTPDWGLMVQESQSYFATHWWIGTFPGLAIMLIAALCYLLGDALRDRLDPRRTARI
ncbi:peptide/nickel transport system permease protein [Spinactinospora alkalitolerans]|uniref:Peptide/nickel transport system permease protein n=1 Tax=Spinactinospora alkalitolerans TaxID=687207 RepID=A0A852TYE2_9ACTN|nr:ABC transporter permease [Spinactinospora alkalitolerans]NYE48811.1 peptide/nickel transport system permease protein [Spinactinospora alkalitolerans]